MKIIKDFMNQYRISPYDEESHTGLVRHALIRKGFRTGQLMVCLIINGSDLPQRDAFVRMLLQVEGMTSISLSINREQTNVIMGKEIVNLYGPGYIEDFIGNVAYQISPLSFYQVNPVQTEKLYGEALAYAGLTGTVERCVGQSPSFWPRRPGRSTAWRSCPRPLRTPGETPRFNGIENAEFFVGKAEEVLPREFARTGERADVIVVDPPRKGCDKVCLDTILKMGPGACGVCELRFGHAGTGFCGCCAMGGMRLRR